MVQMYPTVNQRTEIGRENDQRICCQALITVISCRRQYNSLVSLVPQGVYGGLPAGPVRFSGPGPGQPPVLLYQRGASETAYARIVGSVLHVDHRFTGANGLLAPLSEHQRKVSEIISLTSSRQRGFRSYSIWPVSSVKLFHFITRGCHPRQGRIQISLKTLNRKRNISLNKTLENRFVCWEKS